MQTEKVMTGSILIGLGLWFLLANLGLLNWSTLAAVSRFWPVLLVLAGLDLIVRRTRWWFLSVACTVLIFAAVVGFGLTGGTRQSGGSWSQPKGPERWFHSFRDLGRLGPTVRRELADPLPTEARTGRIKLSFGAADIAVAGGSDGLYSLRSNSNYPEPPVARYTLEGDQATVRLWQPGVDRLVGRAVSEWDLRLTERLPLAIEVDGGASELDLDLSRLRVTDLDIKAGASDIDLKLGPREKAVRVDIAAGASRLSLSVPRGAGLMVESKGVFAGHNLDEMGLVRQGDAFVTNGFDNAQSRITVKFSSAASDLDLDFY